MNGWAETAKRWATKRAAYLEEYRKVERAIMDRDKAERDLSAVEIELGKAVGQSIKMRPFVQSDGSVVLVEYHNTAPDKKPFATVRLLKEDGEVRK